MVFLFLRLVMFVFVFVFLLVFLRLLIFLFLFLFLIIYSMLEEDSHHAMDIIVIFVSWRLQLQTCLVLHFTVHVLPVLELFMYLEETPIQVMAMHMDMIVRTT